MTDRDEFQERRSDPRFPIVFPQGIDLSIARPQEPRESAGVGERQREVGHEILSASLVDLSLSGARFNIDRQLIRGDAITLRLRVPTLNLELIIPAEVSWYGARTSRWDIGCQFRQPIPGEVLDTLAAAAYLERRRDSRSSISGEALLTQSSSAPTLVQLKDMSQGGISFRSPCAVDLDQPLLLEVNGQAESLRITAQPQWQLSEGERYLVGCAFRNAHCAQVLQRSLQPSRPAPRSTVARIVKMSKWGLVGLVLLLVYSLFWLLSDSSL
jgi:hypothetical protein